MGAGLSVRPKLGLYITLNPAPETGLGLLKTRAVCNPIMGATGIGLAAWLRNPAQEELVRDKRVLELGCGCGLPGIAYYLVQWDIVYFNGTLLFT